MTYDPQADPRAERRRVAGLLKTRIHEMASSLPPHKPIPFYEHERMLQMQALHRPTARLRPPPIPLRNRLFLPGRRRHQRGSPPIRERPAADPGRPFRQDPEERERPRP